MLTGTKTIKVPCGAGHSESIFTYNSNLAEADKVREEVGRLGSKAIALKNSMWGASASFDASPRLPPVTMATLATACCFGKRA